MSNSALTALVAVIAALSLAAVVLAGLALRRAPGGGRTRRERPVPSDVAGLQREVERLRRESAGALRHLAIVRYDAFGDMGGRLSWSLALADEDGDGVVLTSITGRSDARTYAKSISGWAADQPLSPEEDEAVAQARAER